MCRMVGVAYRGEFPVGTLNDLRHVAEVGAVPDESERGHRDGWGIVSFMNGSPRYIGRSPRPMHLDPSFDSAVQGTQTLQTPNILIAHARAASRGGAKMENTHPFVIDGIVLAHNGTVYSPLRKTEKTAPKGESDSEILAMLLAEKFDETKDLERAFKSLVVEDLGGKDFSAAILLVSDGKTLFGYRDYKSDDRASYYDLRIARCKDYVALYQESFMGYSGDVSQVAKGELVSVSMDLTIKRRMLA